MAVADFFLLTLSRFTLQRIFFFQFYFLCWCTESVKVKLYGWIMYLALHDASYTHRLLAYKSKTSEEKKKIEIKQCVTFIHTANECEYTNKT